MLKEREESKMKKRSNGTKRIRGKTRMLATTITVLLIIFAISSILTMFSQSNKTGKNKVSDQKSISAMTDDNNEQTEEVKKSSLEYYKSQIAPITDTEFNGKRFMVTNTYNGPVISAEKTVKVIKIDEESKTEIKEDYSGYVKEGTVLEYTITARNSGEIEKTDLLIVDDIEGKGITFISGSIKINGESEYEGTDFSLKTVDDLANRNEDGDGIKVKVPAKGETKLSFRVTVDELKGEDLEKLTKDILNAATVGQITTDQVEVKVSKADIQKGKSAVVVGKETSIVEKNDKITYTITVENTGEAKENNITVEDTIPVGTAYVENSAKIIDNNNNETPIDINDLINGNVVFDLDAHTTKKIQFTVNVTGMKNETEELEDSATIKNVAKVNGEDVEANPNTYIKPIIKATKKVTKLDGTEIKDTDYILEGSKLKYTIVIANEGSKEKEVKVVDVLSAEDVTFDAEFGIDIVGATKQEGLNETNLAEGIQVIVPAKSGETNGKVEISFVVTVNELPKGEVEKDITNVAVVDEENTNTTTTTINKPDLQVRKTSNLASNEKVKAGDEITYTIELDNSKGTAPTTATVSDSAPTGTTFKDVAKVMNGDTEEKTLTEQQLQNGTEIELAAGEIKKIVLTVIVGNKADATEDEKIANGDMIKNTATVNDNTVESPENEYVEPIITSRKEITKANDFVVRGEKVTYTITVENSGGLEKVVKIQDNISSKLTVDENSIIVKVNDQEIETEKDLANGISVTVPAKADGENGKVEVIFDATVKSDATGEITNKAIIDEEETEEVKVPVVTFSKSLDIISKADELLQIPANKATKGDEIVYKVEVTNSGTEAANNIIVTDTVPEGTSLKENSITEAGTTTDNQNITWNISSLAVGETKELSFTVTVTEDQEERTIENTAIVAGKPTNTVTTEVQLLTQITIKHKDKITGDEIAEGETITLKVPTNYDYSNEQKSIEGYNFDSAENVSGTVGIDPITVTFWYVPNTGVLIIEHIDEFDGDTIKIETRKGYNYGDKYETEPGTFEGYDLVEDRLPENASGEIKDKPITVQYFYKYRSSVTIKYIDIDTNEYIIPEETKNGHQGDTYDVVIKEFDKYELVEDPEDNGTIERDPKIIVYKYSKKPAFVEVRHYEEGTTNKVDETVTYTGKIDEEYEAKPSEEIVNNKNSKYELVSNRPTDKDGNEIDPIIIMTEEKIIVTYYYRVKDTNIIIKYLEKDTNEELQPTRTPTYKVDEEYTQDPVQTIEKDGKTYTLVEHTDNLKGTATLDPKVEIIFYYLQNTKVIVNHIDKTTNKVIDTVQQNGLVGDEYTATSKNIPGYVLVDKPDQETVTMTKDEIILNYYYEPAESGVIEKHIDQVTKEILYNEVHKGNVGDPYEILAKEFEGYDLVKTPANYKGVMAENETEVVYEYRHKASVTTKYIDRATGKELLESKRTDGHEEDPYTTERKQIDGYVLIEVPENADGKMGRDDITVTYIYAHLTGGVIERHIDIKTGKQLVPEEKFEGYEGDSYKTEAENIPYYDLVKDRMPTNAEGTMTIEQIVVEYYYIKQSSVTVKYVDKNGKPVLPEETISGHQGDKYTTEEKEIPGYKLIKVPDNKEGTMTDGQTEVVYVYARPAKVIVNYIDVETNRPISTEETITGYEGETYETTSKEIKYYRLEQSKLPSNSKGTMKDGETLVNYYYRKLNFNLTVDKIIKDITINGRTITVNGDLGKVEIYRKEVQNAKIQITYTIKVRNSGELSGKAKLLENIPTGTKMNKANNPEWTIGTTSSTLETPELKPGESKEYTVILDWVNSENNIGTQKNVVEILSSSNEAGFIDSNKSDDTDSAEVIVTISTGATTYIALMGTVLVILAGAVILIKRKNRN